MNSIAFLSFLIVLRFCVSTQLKRPTKKIEVTAEDEKLRDPDGYLSIKAIHNLLDDDHSGSIDRHESADFLAEDFKLGEFERERREKAFHENDELITVDDLWEVWFQSDIREWDEKQVVDWLVNSVKLPQYANNFIKARVTGADFPRLAFQNSSFLNSLDIKSSVHRQKLQLKALDLVLFGPRDSPSLLKDIALAILLASLITVLIIFKTHKNRSRKQMDELSVRLSKLRDMETDFEGVQKKLGDEGLAHLSMSDINDQINEKGVENPPIIFDLETERRGVDLDTVVLDSNEHLCLQTLLRGTYEKESIYLDQQRSGCLKEMREAMELVDKMRRKQGSIVNSLKLAAGATSGTDDIDARIFSLRSRMETIKLSMEELVQRWVDIESICGFTITGPFGCTQTTDTNMFRGPKHQTPVLLRRPQPHLEHQYQQQQQHFNSPDFEQFSAFNGVQQCQEGYSPQIHFSSQHHMANHFINRPTSRQSESSSMPSNDSSITQNKKRKSRFKYLFQRKSKMQT